MLSISHPAWLIFLVCVVLKLNSTVSLEEILNQFPDDEHLPIDALIIRTLPNDASKQSRDYALEPDYPVLNDEAMNWIAGREMKHLLIDTPSIDRAHDGGQLNNHRRWWGMHHSQPHCYPEHH
jgi:kynurenine formamidase